MEDVIVREDVVKGFCFYLQQKLERSVKEKKLRLSHHGRLNLEIRYLCASGVINYKERDEIQDQLKTMFCDAFRQIGLQHNNLA